MLSFLFGNSKPSSSKSMKPSQQQLLSAENTVIEFNNPNSKTRDKLLITVAIHGDEVCGMMAFNGLINQGYFDDLTKFSWRKLTVLVGNPKAVIANERFLDINLNRIFVGEHDESLYEVSRVKTIKKYIRECDYYLDIHSTSSSSLPFGIATESQTSKEYAETFPISFVIEDIVKTLQGTSLQYAHEHNIENVLCVECGHHTAFSSAENAKRVIMHFVGNHPVNLPPKQEDEEQVEPIVLSCTSNQAVREGFEFVKPFEAFEKVAKGDLIAKDNYGDILCPFEEAFLIMPTSHQICGEEAWFWGVRKQKADKV